MRSSGVQGESQDEGQAQGAWDEEDIKLDGWTSPTDEGWRDDGWGLGHRRGRANVAVALAPVALSPANPGWQGCN